MATSTETSLSVLLIARMQSGNYGCLLRRLRFSRYFFSFLAEVRLSDFVQIVRSRLAW
jgi:hypothetical protein